MVLGQLISERIQGTVVDWKIIIEACPYLSFRTNLESKSQYAIQELLL